VLTVHYHRRRPACQLLEAGHERSCQLLEADMYLGTGNARDDEDRGNSLNHMSYAHLSKPQHYGTGPPRPHITLLHRSSSYTEKNH
jgi:hypothetical protein